MNTEIEVKFADVDHDIVRNKLSALGAVLEQPMRVMKRVTIDSPTMKAKNAFMRVRDEGYRVTMTYKQFDALSVDGAKEIEIEVSSFDDAIALLGEGGLSYSSYQETKRETWKLGATEIVLDEWPWLKPYIEIEGESTESVMHVAEELGFNWDDALFGDVMSAYRAQYPHLTLKDTVGNIREVKFGAELPDLLKDER